MDYHCKNIDVKYSDIFFFCTNDGWRLTPKYGRAKFQDEEIFVNEKQLFIGEGNETVSMYLYYYLGEIEICNLYELNSLLQIVSVYQMTTDIGTYEQKTNYLQIIIILLRCCLGDKMKH